KRAQKTMTSGKTKQLQEAASTKEKLEMSYGDKLWCSTAPRGDRNRKDVFPCSCCLRERLGSGGVLHNNRTACWHTDVRFCDHLLQTEGASDPFDFFRTRPPIERHRHGADVANRKEDDDMASSVLKTQYNPVSRGDAY